MNVFRAVPDDIRAYGAVAAGAAAHIAATEATDIAADVTALAPAFGVIGADFVATYATTRAIHAGSVAALGAVYAGTASVAHAVAAAYDATDQATGIALGDAAHTLGDNA